MQQHAALRPCHARFMHCGVASMCWQAAKLGAFFLQNQKSKQQCNPGASHASPLAQLTAAAPMCSSNRCCCAVGQPDQQPRVADVMLVGVFVAPFQWVLWQAQPLQAIESSLHRPSAASVVCAQQRGATCGDGCAAPACHCLAGRWQAAPEAVRTIHPSLTDGTAVQQHAALRPCHARCMHLQCGPDVTGGSHTGCNLYRETKKSKRHLC